MFTELTRGTQGWLPAAAGKAENPAELWMAARTASCARDGWGLCGACLSCSQGSKAFQAPLKTFVQWGKIPAVVFETWAVSAAHAQLTR